MIKLMVIGHLGKDCIVNNVNNNTVINFSVAHSGKYKDGQGNVINKTTWVSCSYWTQSTGIAPYLKKGQQVYVEGTPSVDVYNSTGRNAEGIIGMQKLRVFKVELLGASNKNSGDGLPARTTNADRIPDASEITEPIDDLPF